MERWRLKTIQRVIAPRYGAGHGTDSAFKEMRDSLGTGVVDTAQIVIVSSDSVCNLATGGVRRAATAGPTSGAFLVVVRIGMFYAAASGASELIGHVYMLDDHFRFTESSGSSSG